MDCTCWSPLLIILAKCAIGNGNKQIQFTCIVCESFISWSMDIGHIKIIEWIGHDWGFEIWIRIYFFVVAYEILFLCISIVQ